MYNTYSYSIWLTRLFVGVIVVVVVYQITIRPQLHAFAWYFKSASACVCHKIYVLVDKFCVYVCK